MFPKYSIHNVFIVTPPLHKSSLLKHKKKFFAKTSLNIPFFYQNYYYIIELLGQ